MTLEALVEMLDTSEYTRAVRKLPAADRRRLAQAALARAENNVVGFPQRGAR